jgi:hypothetical protein
MTLHDDDYVILITVQGELEIGPLPLHTPSPIKGQA